MKRIAAAFAICIISVILAVLGSQYVDKTLNEIINAIEQDDNIAEKWDEKKEKLSVLLKHEDIDSVDEEISAMKKFKEEGKDDDAEECKIRAESYIKGIIDGEKLSLGNVF